LIVVTPGRLPAHDVRGRAAGTRMPAMNSLSASPTGRRPPAPPSARAPRLAFVEDLNWPVPGLPPPRKPVRLPEVRAPGREGLWDDTPLTRQ